MLYTSIHFVSTIIFFKTSLQFHFYLYLHISISALLNFMSYSVFSSMHIFFSPSLRTYSDLASIFRYCFEKLSFISSFISFLCVSYINFSMSLFSFLFLSIIPKLFQHLSSLLLASISCFKFSFALSLFLIFVNT